MTAQEITGLVQELRRTPMAPLSPPFEDLDDRAALLALPTWYNGAVRDHYAGIRIGGGSVVNSLRCALMFAFTIAPHDDAEAQKTLSYLPPEESRLRETAQKIVKWNLRAEVDPLHRGPRDDPDNPPPWTITHGDPTDEMERFDFLELEMDREEFCRFFVDAVAFFASPMEDSTS